MQIKKLSEIDHSASAKIVVYGASGAGKTTLIAGLPQPVLVLSAESGLLSLAGRDIDADVVEIKTVEDMRAAFAFLRGTHRYKSVALDSVSEIAEVVLVAEKANKAHKDPRQAYGALIDQMTALLKSFRDLPLVVYMSAKEDRTKDEATGRMTHQIGMPGSKLASALPYLFDEVLRLVVGVDQETGERVRMLQTQPDATSDAKDRSGKLAAMEPADLGAVIAKLGGGNSVDVKNKTTKESVK